MCGIIGVYRWSRDAPAVDLEPLRHRGPDGEGQWRSPEGNCVLGHTRLAILDLSPGGAQPMVDPENGNCIVFNGEIYNHLELRKDLERAGCRWNGTSDTETLLAAYRHWGTDCLRRLKGMFVFAIHDAGGGIFLARDGLGIKPLYWIQEAEGLRFCSEVRPLLPDAGPLLPELFTGYLRWGACPDEQPFSKTLGVFPAGKWLRACREGILGWGAFWPPKSLRSVAGSYPAVEVRQRLEAAVSGHLLSDVPVACFLSGGVDSSILTALAADKVTGQLRTFAVGFSSQRKFDETEVAEEVARRFRTDHCRIEVSDEEAVALVEEAVTRMDCPSVDAVNVYIVARKASELGIRVALSGLGGDELFGGYPSFRDVPLLARYAGLPRAIRLPLGRVLSHWKQGFADVPAGDVALLARWRRRLFSNAEIEVLGLPGIPAKALPAPDLPDDFSRIAWQELSGYMRSMLLRDADQMAMAVSLELRVPFLDHELVEFVMGLPCAAKNIGTRPKGLLIEAFRNLLPSSVYERKKMGFSLPMDAWMRGPLARFCADGLQSLINCKLLSESGIRDIEGRFSQGRIHWSRLWALVVLGKYLLRNPGQ